MALHGKAGGGGDFKKVPQGTHLAICSMVVELGLQRTTYMGEEKVKHQVYVRWEIPGERIEWEKDGEKHEGPMSIGNTYTVSMHENANLAKHIETWRGQSFVSEAEREAFDITKILGQPCMLTVVHNEKGDKTYANVAGVVALPKGVEVPVLESEAVLFEMGMNSDKLPEWLQKKILDRVVDDYQPPQSENPGPPDVEPDIPF